MTTRTELECRYHRAIAADRWLGAKPPDVAQFWHDELVASAWTVEPEYWRILFRSPLTRGGTID